MFIDDPLGELIAKQLDKGKPVPLLLGCLIGALVFGATGWLMTWRQVIPRWVAPLVWVLGWFIGAFVAARVFPRSSN